MNVVELKALLTHDRHAHIHRDKARHERTNEKFLLEISKLIKATNNLELHFKNFPFDKNMIQDLLYQRHKIYQDPKCYQNWVKRPKKES